MPAYVHNEDKGWIQDVDLIVYLLQSESPRLKLPACISDEKLKTARGPYHNLLMLLLSDAGPVSLEIELESGEVLRARGDAVELKLLGEGIVC